MHVIDQACWELAPHLFASAYPLPPHSKCCLSQQLIIFSLFFLALCCAAPLSSLSSLSLIMSSVFDNFVALFSKEKRAALAAEKAVLATFPSLAAASTSSSAQAAAAALSPRRVDWVATPVGTGKLVSYSGNEIVKVALPFGIAFMHLSSVAPLQLVRAPAPVGYAFLNRSSGEFERAFPWGRAVVDPSAEGVKAFYSFSEARIGARTFFGTGVLVGLSRNDGIVQVKLADGTSVFTTLDQITFTEEGEAEPAVAAAAAAVVAEEEAEAEEDASADASKGKKGKGKGKK